ncbi:Os08g0422600, partial [Oryza sativa Japonica Group]
SNLSCAATRPRHWFLSSSSGSPLQARRTPPPPAVRLFQTRRARAAASSRVRGAPPPPPAAVDAGAAPAAAVARPGAVAAAPPGAAVAGRTPSAGSLCRRAAGSTPSAIGRPWLRPPPAYEPGPAFEENSEEAMLDISQTESTELWLIQWPLNQLDASDFHGQEVTLKLHRDGKLSSLDSSSGKSYDLVSFAAQQPDATVFLPSGPEAKAVGKIARRVSLVRYPDPEEPEKPGLGSLTPSSKKSAGSSKKTRSRFSSGSKNRSSQGSALSLGQQSAEPAHKHNQKRKDESSLGHSNVSGKSAEGSQVRGGDSGTTLEVPQTPGEKSKKKNKKVRIAE